MMAHYVKEFGQVAYNYLEVKIKVFRTSDHLASSYDNIHIYHCPGSSVFSHLYTLIVKIAWTILFKSYWNNYDTFYYKYL